MHARTATQKDLELQKVLFIFEGRYASNNNGGMRMFYTTNHMVSKSDAFIEAVEYKNASVKQTYSTDTSRLENGSWEAFHELNWQRNYVTESKGPLQHSSRRWIERKLSFCWIYSIIKLEVPYLLKQKLSVWTCPWFPFINQVLFLFFLAAQAQKFYDFLVLLIFNA